MRVFFLMIWLVCAGLQAIIVTRQAEFVHALFGQVDNPTLVALFAIGALGVIEALILVLWVISAAYETTRATRHQEESEHWSEIGQSSRLPGVRGRSIARMINSVPDRARASLVILRVFALPFAVFALIFSACALFFLTL